MSVHIAILQKPYLNAVLAGRKTIESRLTKTMQPPHGMVQEGERIFFKLSGGPFKATARAGTVQYFDQLTPPRIDALRQRFNDAVCGTADYWRMKRSARFATFIELDELTPTEVGPRFTKSPYRAWFVLPDEADPVFEVTLTAGALRNGYVPVAKRPAFFGPGDFELLLPDGERVRTDLYQNQRIRWRGWRRQFELAGIGPGDKVRFVAMGEGRYRVTWMRAADRSRAVPTESNAYNSRA